jgi:hypothetical protein
MNKFLLIKDTAEKAAAAESDRTRCLLSKAEKIAAVVIIATGYQLLDVKTLLESTSVWVRSSSYASLTVLSVSLFFTFQGMRLKGYADYPRGNALWDKLAPETVSEDAAQEALVQLLLKTREQNAKLNDAKAKFLSWSCWLLFLGVLLIAAGQWLDALIDVLPLADS